MKQHHVKMLQDVENAAPNCICNILVTCIDAGAS